MVKRLVAILGGSDASDGDGESEGDSAEAQPDMGEQNMFEEAE